ncbi:MAG: hypothetical protein HKN80_00965 [Acidimicrobiia bacterium]|nr:hypothetical protein [Acidimicrobiia bacterium]
MTATETVVTIVALTLMVLGVLAAVVIDVRAHDKRPGLDRLWLVLPAIGLLVLAVTALNR